MIASSLCEIHMASTSASSIRIRQTVRYLSYCDDVVKNTRSFPCHRGHREKRSQFQDVGLEESETSELVARSRHSFLNTVRQVGPAV